MAVFAESPDKFVDSFSAAFEKEFMDVLSRRFGTRRIQANYVYNEHIQQKLHTHMNSTMWTTLTDFVKYLGRTGKCTIEETEKGWFITWINRDPEVVKRQESAARREAEELAAARQDDELADLAARAAAAAGADADAPRYTELQRDPAQAGGAIQRIKVSLGCLPSLAAGAATASTTRPALVSATSDEAIVSVPATGKRSRFDVEVEPPPPSLASAAPSASAHPLHTHTGGPLSNLASIMAEDGRMKAAAAARSAAPSRFDRPAATIGGLTGGGRSTAPVTAPSPASAGDSGEEDRWLLPGIIVKILNKRVGDGRYYKAKAEVLDVQGDGYVGVVKVLDSGDVLRVDQADLQTVVPARGGGVIFVRGRRRGQLGVLLEIVEARFCATLRLETAEVVEGVEYEDFSRAAIE